MNPMGLMELAQIAEQEHMREALRRKALREARKQAGVTWIQLVRARLFGSRSVVSSPEATAAQASAAQTVAASNSVAPTTNTRPVLVHEVRIRPQSTRTAGSVARPSAPAPTLRVVQPAELDCVGADC